LEKEATIFLNNSSEESTSTDIQSNQLSSEESKSSVSCLFPERSFPKESMSMDTSKKSLYKKRGAAKKLKTSDTKDALDLMKQMISQPTVIPQVDAAKYFGSARLREMDLIQRRHCEDMIIKILNSS